MRSGGRADARSAWIEEAAMTAMAAMRVRETLRMARGEVRRVVAVRGTAIRVARGRVWLTEHGGGKDWDVPACALHRVYSAGVTVIESLAPAVVEVLQPVPLRTLAAEILVRGWRRALRRLGRVDACARTDNPA
jgi:hypothetical protein